MKRWTPVPQVSDRKFWDRIAGTEYGKMMIAGAEEILTLPHGNPSEEIYRDSFVTRDRAKYEFEFFTVVRQARGLAIAILCEPRQEFIDRFCETLGILSKMKTWVLPAHDRYPHVVIPQSNIDERVIITDLFSLEVSAGFCIALEALKEVIPAEVSAEFLATAKRLVIDPVTLIARNRRPYDYWMIASHNWNAVCYCNIILTFLASDIPENQRQLVIDFSLDHLKYFLTGFTEDGYCLEGPGYFAYGFGHYTYLSWALYEASGHTLNLFDNDRVRLISAFPEKMMMSENQLPLFCDCNPKLFIRRDLMEIRDYLLGKSESVDFLPPKMKESGRPQDLDLSQQLLLAGFSKSEKMREITLNKFDAFPKTGVFVWRENDLAFCIKGGNNQEYHNHNDVGSYVLVYKDTPLLLDPGQPRYTMDSFHSKKAFDNKLRSSYAHPVPTCNGSLQLWGKASQAKVLEYSENGVTFDITAPYRDTPATQLLRKIDFNRMDCQVTITDSAEFSEDSNFAVPLITFGKWEVVSPDMLRIYRDGEWEFFCEVDASAEYEITDELVDDNILFDEPVRRILFTFKEKAKSFKISTTFIMEKK